MTRLLLPLGILMAASGCIIYDEDVRYAEDDEPSFEEPAEQPESPTRPDAPGEDGDDVDGNDEGVDEPALVVVPDAAVSGETVIVTILAKDEVLDLTTVEEVQFYGDAEIEVLASLPRGADELIVTLVIPDGADPGDQDLLVEFDDGSAEFIRDAFLVVESPDDLPDDAWDGLPDSSSDGASGDGNGGSSGGSDDDSTAGGGSSSDGGASGDGDDHDCPCEEDDSHDCP